MSGPAVSEMIDCLNAALESRYRIERELGAGGMATVYLAEDLKHHWKVAVNAERGDVELILVDHWGESLAPRTGAR